MTRILLLAASLGLAVSGAQACELMRSAAKVDTNTTASVSSQDPQTSAMSTPETVATAEPAQTTTVVVPQSE